MEIEVGMWCLARQTHPDMGRMWPRKIGSIGVLPLALKVTKLKRPRRSRAAAGRGVLACSPVRPCIVDEARAVAVAGRTSSTHATTCNAATRSAERPTPLRKKPLSKIPESQPIACPMSLLVVLLAGLAQQVAASGPALPSDPVVPDLDFADPVVLQHEGRYYAYANGGIAIEATGPKGNELSEWSKPWSYLVDSPDWATDGALGGAPGVVELENGTLVHLLPALSLGLCSPLSLTDP